MAGFKLHNSDRAETSPAVQIIYEGVSELVQEGHFPYTGLSLGVRPDDSVIYAVSGPGDLVGVLCYSARPGYLHVSLIYVEPSSRRLGIMNAMWNVMMERAKAYKGGDFTAQMLIHKDNKLAQQIFAKRKFAPVHNSPHEFKAKVA